MTDGSFAARMFAGIAVFMALIGTVYWFASYEPAGTTMLAMSAALAAVCAAYLAIHKEHRDGTAAETSGERSGATAGDASRETETSGHYLPHASIWPFVLGAGAWLTTNGLVVGFGYAIPGLVVIAVSVVGLVAQSRHRA